MFYVTDEDAVEVILDAAIGIAKRSHGKTWEECFGAFTTPCREHGPHCESWPRCSAEAYNEHQRKVAKERGRKEARLDAFLEGLQREMRRRSLTFGLTDETHRAAVNNALGVCGWKTLSPDEYVDGMTAWLLTRSLAIAANNPERTPAESSRLRLACIEAGALAMLLGEARPGIE